MKKYSEEDKRKRKADTEESPERKIGRKKSLIE